MRKFLILTMAIIMLFAVSACESDGILEDVIDDDSDPVTDNLEIAMVTTTGIDDNSIGQMAWEGLARAEADLDIKADYVIPDENQNLADLYTELAEKDYDMIWGIGFNMVEPIEKVAPEFPEKKFAIIDMEAEAIDNLVSITFKENEGSYLAGVVAANETESNKIAFIGGVEADLIYRFEAGFRAGITAVNSEAEIYSNYVGGFDEPETAKNIAEDYYNNQDVDIIYHAAGASGMGVIDAAEEANKYVIGVDIPQSELAPDNILTSMIKKVDNAVYNEVRKVVNGDFKSGHQEYGLSSDGVGIYRPQAEKMIQQETLDLVDQYKNEIINGNIEVPITVNSN